MNQKPYISLSSKNNKIDISTGTKKHSNLYELDFESSGHTGFQKELTKAQLEAIEDLSGKEDKSNKVKVLNESALSDPETEEYPTTYATMSAIVEMARDIGSDLDNKLEVKEDKANKISEWKEDLSDEEYPSAKLVKEAVDNVKAIAEDGNGQANEAYLLADQALTEALAAGDAAETALEGVDGKEDTANKVTSITEESTDEQYPSAKAVFEFVGNIETALDGIIALQTSLIGGAN